MGNESGKMDYDAHLQKKYLVRQNQIWKDKTDKHPIHAQEYIVREKTKE